MTGIPFLSARSSAEAIGNSNFDNKMDENNCVGISGNIPLGNKHRFAQHTHVTESEK
ncbi:MAG TPA: hypothetical protein VEL11_18345 [Candidatus Bathyarchaeia archaeon]|nr:hypothetical protein [Candidatus Bathyarchaeia archaeon]